MNRIPSTPSLCSDARHSDGTPVPAAPMLTPAWLTSVLRKNHVLADANVTTLAFQRIGDQVGFLDSLTRVAITYDRPNVAAPKSLIIKVSSSEETYRQIGALYHAYERELHFYESVAPRSPIRLPRCFGREILPADDSSANTEASRDPESLRRNVYILLLEDLSALSPGNQVEGLTPNQALESIGAIGRFHAAWWQSPALDSLTWMPTRNIRPERYQSAWPKFREEFGSRLSPAALALGEDLNIHLESLLDDIESRPQTIVHSDFRADNLLFDSTSATDPVIVLDWQLAIRGPGILNVARLLCGSLNPRDRAAVELSIVRQWRSTLEEGGVQGYPLQHAIDDYRRSARICLYYPVTIHAAEESAGPRGAALAHAQIDRFFTAAEQLASE